MKNLLNRKALAIALNAPITPHELQIKLDNLKAHEAEYEAEYEAEKKQNEKKRLSFMEEAVEEAEEIDAISESLTDKEHRYLSLINDRMQNGTAEEKKRAYIAFNYFFNTNDTGRFGRIEELLNARSKSRKNAVSRQGQIDNYIKVDGQYKSAESKTNGGRIENLLASRGKPCFVIYTLDIETKHKNGIEKRYAKKVIPTNMFIDFLLRYGLIKSTNGRNPERAIQCSSKKLYTALLNYPIDFISDYEYSAEDFEDLTFDI